MTQEQKEQVRVAAKLMVCVGFALLYAYGGMSHKWLRRFLAPSILCGTMLIFTRDWRSLLQLPFMFGALSLGYGAVSLWGKIIRRLIFGLAIGTASSGYNIIKKRWLLVATQIVLLVGLYIVMGVWNPMGSARAEETFLGIMICLIPLLSTRST